METAQVSGSMQADAYQPISGIVPDSVRISAMPEAILACRPQHFDEAFEQSINELVEQKKQIFEAMTTQVTRVLEDYSTNTGLLKEATLKVTDVICQSIEQLVAAFDKSILAFSEIYIPWREDLLRVARARLQIRPRKGDEETSTIGLCAGAVVGAGVGGVGGAFLGAMLGDLAGGLFGEPVDTLRKRAAKKVKKKTRQIDEKISEFITSQTPDIKKLLICKRGLSWPAQSVVTNEGRFSIN